MENSEVAELKRSPIQDFFRNRSVLVTGGTGFLGKVLIEKLLYSCPDLRGIYILLRPKRGQDVNMRYKTFLADPIFNRVKAKWPEKLQKVLPIHGDISEPDLGLSNEDMATLRSNVNIVFHSAATVRFNEPLKTAVMINTLGTKRILQLCDEITELKAFVYVSTAFVHPDKREVKEMAYNPPGDPDNLINMAFSLSIEEMENATKELQKKHPNTYTLTKAMAEWIVFQNANKFPTAIVRPSAVTPAHLEPYPGWIDNLGAGVGIAVGVTQGIVRTVVCDTKLPADYMPVDYVINTLIAAAWHISTYRENNVKVFNCTSASRNPVYWHEVISLMHKYGRSIPCESVMWYPEVTARTNKSIHRIYEILLHFLPAIGVDAVLKFQGGKPRLFKWAKCLNELSKLTEFFSCQYTHFHTDNVKYLLSDSNDKKMFYIDIEKLEWESYLEVVVRGIRKYIIKESDETITNAKAKLQRLYWIHCFSKFLVYMVILQTIYFILTCFYANTD